MRAVSRVKWCLHFTTRCSTGCTINGLDELCKRTQPKRFVQPIVQPRLHCVYALYFICPAVQNANAMCTVCKLQQSGRMQEGTKCTKQPVAQPGFGDGGTGGLGNGSPPAGSRGRAPGGWFGGSIASRKLIAVIKDIWLPNHAQFCVFSSTAQPRIFL